MLKFDDDLLKEYDGSTYRKLREEPTVEPPRGKPEKQRGILSDAVASMGGQTVGMLGDVSKWITQGDNSLSDWAKEKEASFDADKSAKLRGQSEEFSRIVADPDKDWVDALSFVVTNPYFAAQTAVGSLPTMLIGGGVGGAAAKGVAVAGRLGATGTRIAATVGSGLGEGIPMGAGIYDESGSNVAALAGVGLGLGTAFMPGNVETALARKIAGKPAAAGADELSYLGLQGAKYAGARALATGGKEGIQELGQETGEALLTQAGKGEDLNFREASKQGVLGAIAGAGTGVALHPFVGEGAALTDAKKGLAAVTAAANKAGGQDENLNKEVKVAQDVVSRLELEQAFVLTPKDKRTDLQRFSIEEARAKEAVSRGVEGADDAYALAKTKRVQEEVRLNPASTPEQTEAANAAVEAAADPGDQEKKNRADTSASVVLNETVGPAGIDRIADETVAAAQRQILDPITSLDAAIATSANAAEASAMRTTAAAQRNVETGIGLAVGERLGEEIKRIKEAANTVNQEMFPVEEVAAPAVKPSDRIGLNRDTPGEVVLDAINLPETTLEQIDTGPVTSEAQQALVENTAFPEITGFAPAPTATGGGYTTRTELDNVNRRVVTHVINPDGSIFDTYAGPVAEQDAQATADRLNARATAPAAAADPRQAYLDWQVGGGGTQEDAERRANAFANQSTGDLQNIVDDAALSEPPRAYARFLLNQTRGSGELSLHTDGIIGNEIPHTRVRGGNDAFQYAVGTTVAGGTPAIFRRRADERGTYGGWRFEDDRGAVLPEQAPAASTSISDRVIDAEQEMAQEGYNPGAAADMRMATDQSLMDIFYDIRALPGRANYAALLLEQRGNPITPPEIILRKRVDDAAVALANGTGRTVGIVRSALENMTEDLGQRILNNPTVSEQHAAARALGDFRGWNLQAPATPTPAPTGDTVTDEQVERLRDEDLLDSRGYLRVASSQTLNAFGDNANDEAAHAINRLFNWRIAAGDEIALLDQDSQTALEWGMSDEGLQAGVSPDDMTRLVEIRVVLGLVSDDVLSAEEQAELNDELQDELTDDELQAQADDETLQDWQRTEARQELRERRAERRAARRAARTVVAPLPGGFERAPSRLLVNGVRPVERNFATRAAEAQRDGTLRKLGTFWKNLMSRRNRGQRTFPAVNAEDLRAQFEAARTGNRPIEASALIAFKDKYNAALRAKAEEWAASNNKPITQWVNPIVSISSSGSGVRAGFSMSLRSLNRNNGENPFMANPAVSPANFGADYTIHASLLEYIPGSADLAYRMAAHVADLRGRPFPSDAILSTVNPLRRQLQSMSADTLFGAGTIHPLTNLSNTSTDAGPQGIMPATWRAMRDDVEKIGLNSLRASHSLVVNRGSTGRLQTAGQFLENLAFDRQGRIYARSEPAPMVTSTGGAIDPSVSNAFAFPRGAFVTEEDLKAKIRADNPVTGSNTYGRASSAGGIGLDSAKHAILMNTILAEIEGKPDAEIPAWIGALARRLGRDMGGWFFSEAEQAGPAATAITKAEAENTLRNTVGDTAAKLLLDTGLVRFVETPAELADLGGVPLTSISGAVQGATMPDGTIVLVTGNLTGKNAAAVLQHEALHATLKALVGEDTYNRLMSRLDTMLQAGKGAQWVADARAAVPANTPTENVLEETAAYAVEQYAKNPESTNPLVRWARDFMSAIRSAIIQNKALPEALRVWAIQNVQPQDFARMVIAGLKKQANAAGTMRESQRDWADEIAALMEEHKSATPERRSEINDELRTLRKFQRAADEVAFEKGFTNEARNIRGEAAGVPAQAEYGTPREGAVSVDATHFSNAQRNQLSTAAYGTGAKGEEAGRLGAAENADIRDRTHFYVNEGTGIRPEAGVGGVAHNVKLNNLYDIKADPLGYRAFNRNDPSAMERAIVKAGFDGYYAPDYANGQGVAVVIGHHTIPVSPGEGGVNVEAQFQGDTYAANLAKSKLPGGRMSGREWLVAIKGTEFDTPRVRAELEAREAQSLYRDDLPRFNKQMKFSIAQEMNHITEPVAPSPAPLHEFTIRDSSLSSPTERIYSWARKLVQDKNVTLRKIQQLAGVTAEQLKMDTMGALDRLGSVMASTQKRLVQKPLAQIETILSEEYKNDGEAAHKDITELLINLHVPEYNGRIATVNPAKYGADGKLISGFDEDHPGSGIKTADAKAAVAKLMAGPHAEALNKAVEVYREMITALQNYAVAQGLEKQEVIDAWRDPETGFSNYTPFHRELDLEENLGIGTAKGAQGFSLRTGITQRAMGSSKEIFDPLAATLILGTRIVSRGENAVVARTMLEFAKNVAPNFVTGKGANERKRPMWKVDVVPETRVIKRTNIYKTKNADGTMSPEFYNREQARLHADTQQALWEKAHPNEDPNDSGIIAELIDTADRVFIQPVPMPLNLENVMVIPVKGENHFITFDKDSNDAMAILNALKGTSTFGSSKATKAVSRALTPFRMFARWTVAMATGYNPVFVIFNAARDVQAAMINAKDGGVPGWTWEDSRKIPKNFRKAFSDINNRLAEEFDYLHSNKGQLADAPRGSWGWWMDQAEKSGGLTGIMEHIVEPEEARTMIRRLYGTEVEKTTTQAEADDWLSKGEGFILKVGDVAYRFGQGETTGNKMGAWASKQLAARVARWNSSAEAATRTIVFKEAFEKYVAQGASEQDAMKLAANISKNISTNFNRRGNITTLLNQLFPFFNAAVQGSARLAEAVFEKHPVAINRETGEKVTVGFTNDANGNRIAVNAETKAPLDMSKVSFDQETTYLTPFGKQIVGSLVTVGAMQSALLLLAGFDDDEPPQSVKDRAFIIPLGDKDYMAIPMPHGFNTMINFGREMADAVAAGVEGKGGKALEHIIHGTAGQAAAFNPLGGQGNWQLGISPALADPFVALSMNKDVFGRQIAREDMNPRDLTPGFTRSKEGVNPIAQGMAEMLNYLTGGNEDQPGLVSPTGDQIAYLFGEIGGGVAREGAKVINLGMRGVKAAAGEPQEDLPITKVPLIGRILGTASDAPGLRNRAFEISGELNSLDNRYKGLLDRAKVSKDPAEKAALRQQAADFKAEHPELSLADDFNRFYTEDRKAKKQRALARGNDDTLEANRITDTQTEKARKLLDKYDALVE